VAEGLERFLALVKRELGCDDVQVVEPGGDAIEGAEGRVLLARLPDGHLVAARFQESPPDAEVRLRRLEMLVSTFDAMVVDETQPVRRSRPPVTSSLHEELSALCARAASLNAIVIDANSPVIWGAAHPEGLASTSPDDSAELGIDQPANDGIEGESPSLLASHRALRVARGWEDLAALRRGKRLRRVEREGETPILAHSFAGIYVLVLAYGGGFDELRAERAVLEALPRIERLVMALPPLDPQPPTQGAGVVALRRPRRR
jgi:hypothetical protein